MSDNVAGLIDHAVTMCDELDLLLNIHYSKKNIRFLFMKNDVSIGWDFTTEEVENVIDVNLQKKVLTDRVYSLLDNYSRK